MPTPLILIEELKAYLVAQSVGQSVSASGALPVIILDPRWGAPEPKAGITTITLRATGQDVLPPLHEWLEARVVDVIVRAQFAPVGELVQRQIRNLLNEKAMLMLGALQTEWIKLWRGCQPLGSDETSYTTVQSFIVEARLKSLAGTPYFP